MSLGTAVRLCELLLGCAIVQQSLEHLSLAVTDRRLFFARLAFGAALAVGVFTVAAEALLLFTSALIFWRCEGPYNGGSDRLAALSQCCLLLTHLLPPLAWKELALGYLALQVVLSYAVSGWVKIVNPEWRSGQALNDVFAFSAYPVSESLRLWARWPRLLWAMSWAVMGFELMFPISLLHPLSLQAALVVAIAFHVANAVLFGLNRFVWIWLSTYPALLWLQARVLPVAG